MGATAQSPTSKAKARVRREGRSGGRCQKEEDVRPQPVRLHHLSGGAVGAACRCHPRDDRRHGCPVRQRRLPPSSVSGQAGVDVELLRTVTLTEIGTCLLDALLAAGERRFGEIVLEVDGPHRIVTSPSAVVTSIKVEMSMQSPAVA